MTAARLCEMHYKRWLAAERGKARDFVRLGVLACRLCGHALLELTGHVGDLSACPRVGGGGGRADRWAPVRGRVARYWRALRPDPVLAGVS